MLIYPIYMSQASALIMQYDYIGSFSYIYINVKMFYLTCEFVLQLQVFWCYKLHLAFQLLLLWAARLKTNV